MIAFIWHQDGVDYDVMNGQLLPDDGLNTLVTLLLFTDARAKESDELPGNDGKRGWPGSSYSDFAWGSRLWLLDREKITSGLLHKIKNYTVEALKPLIDKNIAKSTDIKVTRESRYIVIMSIEITKPSGDVMNYTTKLRWQSQAASAENQKQVTYGV